MAIVSISLAEEILKQVDTLQKKRGFSGRSEVVRTAINRFLNEEKQFAEVSGKIEGVIIARSKERNQTEINRIQHAHKDLIQVNLHSHINGGKRCMQLFLVSGDASKIKELMRKLQTSKKVEFAKLFMA